MTCPASRLDHEFGAHLVTVGGRVRCRAHPAAEIGAHLIGCFDEDANEADRAGAGPQKSAFLAHRGGQDFSCAHVPNEEGLSIGIHDVLREGI